ncbi:alpha/beta hydrolase [Gryllotalpicola sp.]|uniref:alpha/beta fold hydrolase n=1 Tax=Gryllotalpicola sp. TaxID=1932787 RepID=UPI002628030E|nr:alpha/beta hydrolase [Gryllotalpicola sp.]
MTIVLIHGAATAATVWRSLLDELGDLDEAVIAPQREYSGDWERELDALEPLCSEALVVGVSGGATLGLALALRGVPLRAAVLHEPAAGSLAPHLLDDVAAAWRQNGVLGFGHALYGSSWGRELAPAEDDTVARDFSMFRAFEPLRPRHPLSQLVITVGELSPPVRHESVAALAELTGARTATVPGGRHAVHLDNVTAFAAVIRANAAMVKQKG